MSTTRRWVGFLSTALMFLASTPAISQDTAKKNSADASVADAHPQDPSKKKEKQPALADVTRVSTAEAALGAARDATKEKAKNQKSRQSPDGTEETGVLEFKPASQDADAEAASHPTVYSRTKRKRVHGEAYGSLDPRNSGNHQTGGAVGATTKSGKTSVYVETDQARSTAPTPH